MSPGKCRTVYHFDDEMLDVECDHRRPITPVDVCVEFRMAQVSCPADNHLLGRPADIDDGAWPLIKCRTCGIAPLHGDEDDRRGWWSGHVSWGPNQYEHVLSEAEVSAYKLYVVDSQYQKLGPHLALREVKRWASLRLECCDLEMYEADITLLLPQNASYFMVVPVTVAGLELNVGPTSDRIRDIGNRVAAPIAGGRREAASSVLVTLALGFLTLQFA